MNDLQKKFAIVGSTAFIVWFLMAFESGAFDPYSNSTIFENIDNFISRSIYGYKADWIQTTTFITWVGSLIAYNIYKEDK
tara:strand:+ start:50 stop:289 length:240 start_codon:yes stop_codon:yes gene_type:complete